MKPAPVTLPAICAQRVGPEFAARIVGAGETALLDEPLLGLVASRECPGHVLLETLDLVPEWVKSGRVIVSGFHSPLEQQVLRSVLRREGRVVKVLARGMTDYRPTPEEREPLTSGRMLVVSAFAPEVRRTTRETALARNRLVLALATEIVVPHVTAGSPLAALLSGRELSDAV
ncbi:MAG: DNA-processing protein DprA [Gammaproteobacteria bacterium]|nr:DNA-processing protein DprA [Gammaproteobacteria bacterium]